MNRFRWAAIVCLMVVAVTLNVRNFYLREGIEEARRGSRMGVGHKLQEIPVRRLDASGTFDTELSVESFTADRMQLLFILSPRCGFCRSNLPNWEQLQSFLAGRSVRIFAITLDDSRGIESYQKALQVPIAWATDRETHQVNGFATTPQTALLDPSGEVIQNWTGDLSAALEEVRRTLNERLD